MPLPALISEPLPDSAPANALLALPTPAVSVPLPSKKLPLPESAPTDWAKPLRSTAPPALTSRVPPLPNAPAAPARSVPSVTTVGPV